ncbi:DUF3667 domain-containing protein [Winogradskyella ludwigii]|uniref:DUF3667 domain-containing protein n=1 Tax=Winogradskyella ludwigii TaxID=2686076 RepID=UPI0015CD70FA|nr:DUF3667 domain-containing protein [Winogradskyella ludwigii]
MICISCNTEYNSNFCPNCGEKSGIKKLTFNSIIENAFSTITNMDKGFLYNFKMLFVNPKKISIDYILGKRKGVLNPISFLIISISIYLILEIVFKLPKEQIDNVDRSTLSKKGYDIGQAGGKFIFEYFKYFWIFSILLLANATKIIYRKYSYIEHVAISSFIIGQATLLGIIGFLIFRIPLIFNPILYLAMFILTYLIFYQGKDKFESLLLSFTGLILFIIQLFLVLVILGIVMVQ